MELVVCLKRTINVSQLFPHPETGAPVFELAPHQISDFDENALEEAVRIKERLGGSVSVVTVSPGDPRDVLPKALAMGADRAFAVVGEGLAGLDSLGTATLLAACIRKTVGRFDLILCGEGSVDEYNLQVGPRLSEELSIPCITHASRLEIRGGVVFAERILEDRAEHVSAPLPALVTVGMEINTPRYVPLLRMMVGARKPTQLLRFEELQPPEGVPKGLATLTVTAPKSLRKRVLLQGDAEEAARRLAEALLAEGVVEA